MGGGGVTNRRGAGVCSERCRAGRSRTYMRTRDKPTREQRWRKGGRGGACGGGGREGGEGRWRWRKGVRKWRWLRDVERRQPVGVFGASVGAVLWASWRTERENSSSVRGGEGGAPAAGAARSAGQHCSRPNEEELILGRVRVTQPGEFEHQLHAGAIGLLCGRREESGKVPSSDTTFTSQPSVIAFAENTIKNIHRGL